MTKQNWLQYVTDNQTNLLSLVSLYHPTSNQRPSLQITASRAETACAAVRKSIVEELELKSASERFQDALNEQNAEQIYKLLSDTWFGVPESTECWRVTGFKECVNLLDDPFDWE